MIITMKYDLYIDNCCVAKEMTLEDILIYLEAVNEKAMVEDVEDFRIQKSKE